MTVQTVAMVTSKAIKVVPEEDARELAMREFVAKFETQANASIKRILSVNDIYGNAIIRQAVLDEVNELIRAVRTACLTPFG